MSQRTLKTRLYSVLRQNHTSNWPKYIQSEQLKFSSQCIVFYSFTFAGVVDSINSSPHKNLYGLLPSTVESDAGELTLKLAREKYGKPSGLLSDSEEKDYEKEFYSKKENKYFKKNHFVLADVSLSKKLLKGHNLKRGLITKIIGNDYSNI